MPKVCCIFFVLFLGWIWLMLTQVWLLLLQDPDGRPHLEEDHEQETSHLAALQTVAAEMSPVSWRAPIELIKTCLWNWEVTRNLQVSPGDDSKIPGVEDSNYMEAGSSTFIEMPTTSSTSSGLPTTTSNHTNVTSLHRYQINNICNLEYLSFCPKRKKYKLEKGSGHKFDNFLVTSIWSLLSGRKQ